MQHIEQIISNKKFIDDSILRFMKDTDFCGLVDSSKFVQKKYTRDKLIDMPNAVVYIIYWAKDAYSPPHNHPEGGCILKILNGKLQETSYDLVDNKAVYTGNSKLLVKNSIGIKHGNELHSIKALEDTSSIHIYFPGDYVPTFFGCCDDSV
jgi:hypothetical protein